MAPNRRIGELAVGQAAGANEEQPDHPASPKQDVHEAQPDHPMPFPLGLQPYYESTGPGSLLLQDVNIAKFEITPKEKKHVLDALCLVLQAWRALTLESMPGYAVPTRPFGVRKTTHTFVYSFV